MKQNNAVDNKKLIILGIIAVLLIALIVVIINGTNKKSGGEIGKVVDGSIESLKETWELVYNDIDELVENKTFDTFAAEDRKLEIRGVRVIEVNSEANEAYTDIQYVVEFTLYSNRYRTAPYYVPEDIYDTVIVYKDGRREVRLRNIFKSMADDFRNETVTNLVSKVHDFKDEYNQILDLNKK